MKVNKSSWHYKLWRKCGGNPYNNISLCLYVQRIFWVSLIFSALAVLVLSCAGIILSSVVVATIHHPVVVGCTALAIGAVVCVVCIAYIFIEQPPAFDFLFNREAKPYKEPGLIRSWWRAKKDKVCPLLDFED